MRRIEDLPFQILDINMGCPVPKVVKNGEGSALMKNPKLVFEIVSQLVKAIEKPVTVKIRKGFDDDHINAVEIPQTHPEAKLISQIEEITPEVEALAGGAGSSVGTGGMFTKLQAAKNATSSGINMVIASGSEKDVIARILNGEEIGTLFASKENRLQFRKRWLAFGARIMGKIIVDDGCVKAIKKAGGCSILPAGISGVEGDFEAGNTVSVVTQDGFELARGLCHYSSDELQKIKGCKTYHIEKILGHKNFDEVIHRDDLVILN